MGQSIKLTKEEYEHLNDVMAVEELLCLGTCRETTLFKPYHFSCFTFLKRNGEYTLYNNSCESNGRHYNPETKGFQGRPHCTCDTCF